MKPNLQVAFVLLGLFVSAITTTFAQDIPAYDKMSLADLLNVKIITASKNVQKASDAPATVMVISAKQIKTRGYRNLAEVLNDLPDVKVNDRSDPQIFNTFSIRGITRQDKFVILLDGVKISSPINDQLPVLENFPIYLAKQIEVVFGPGSALYGADAMSGVINIITNAGPGNDVLEARVAGGTHGYSDQYLFWKKTFKNGLNLTAGGQYTYDRQPDLSKVYPHEFNMQGQQTGVFNSAYGTMRPSQPVDAAYSAPVRTYNMYFALNNRGFDFKVLRHYAAVPSSSTLTPDNGVFNKDVFYGQSVTSISTAYTDSLGALRSVTSLQGSFTDVNPNSNFRNLFGNMEHGYKYSEGSMIKVDEQLSVDLFRKMHLTGGLTYELFKALPKSVELSSPHIRGGITEGRLLNSAHPYNPGGLEAKFYPLTYNNFGSFLQAQYTPGKKLAITLGGRFDHNSRFGSTVNPRLGLVYTPSSKTTIKALYGTAYWAPSPLVAYEQYGSFYTLDSGKTYTSNYWHLPNPGLKPVTSETFELSLSRQVNKHFNFSLTGYFIELHGLISGVSDNGNTNLYNNTFLGHQVAYIEVPTNVGTQVNYGGHAMVNTMFNMGNSKFNAWASLSWVDGTVKEYATPAKLTEVQISLIAPWQFRAGIDGNSGAFSYSVRLLRSGRQRVTGFENPGQPYDRQTISGYTLVNANASYSFRQRFGLFVKMQNLLNQRYKLVIPVDLNDANLYTTKGSLQDPLRVMAGVTVRF